MGPTRNDPIPATAPLPAPGSTVNPDLVAALRTALQTLALEQSTHAPGEPSREDHPDDRKRPGWLGQIRQLIGVILVVSTAFLGIFIYIQLGEDQARHKSEIGKLRGELNKMRPHMLSKDDFTSRNLAVHALISGVEADNQAADTRLQRTIKAPATTLEEVNRRIRGMQDDLKDANKRLAVLEKHDKASKPPQPPVDKNEP
jgi:hypothetical protein